MNMPLSVPSIRRTVQDYYGLTEGEIRGPCRRRCVARPRQIAMYLCRELTQASCPRIGMHFHRDHTTVLHAMERAREFIRDDNDYASDIAYLRQMITGAITVTHPKYGESSTGEIKITSEAAPIVPYSGYVPGELTDARSA